MSCEVRGGSGMVRLHFPTHNDGAARDFSTSQQGERNTHRALCQSSRLSVTAAPANHNQRVRGLAGSAGEMHLQLLLCLT